MTPPDRSIAAPDKLKTILRRRSYEEAALTAFHDGISRPAAFRLTWLLPALAVACVLRIGFAVLTVGLDAPPSDDGRDYVLIARNMLAGRGFSLMDGAATSFRPPGYVGLLAGVFFVFGDRTAAARAVQAALGAAGCALLWFAAARFTADRGQGGDRSAGNAVAAWVAFGIAMLYPSFLYLGARILSESLHIPLLCAFIAAAASPAARGSSAAAGLALGLAILTRPVAALYVPLTVAWCAVTARGRCSGWTRGFTIAAAALAVVLPWTLRNALIHRAFVPVATNGGLTLFLANNPWADGGFASPPDAESWREHAGAGPESLLMLPSEMFLWRGMSETAGDRRFAGIALRWIADNPGTFMRSVPRKIVRMFSPAVVSRAAGTVGRFSAWYGAAYVAIAVLSVLGIAAGFVPRPLALLTAMFVGVVLVQAVVFYGSNRLRADMEPALILCAACTVAGLLRRRIDMRR